MKIRREGVKEIWKRFIFENALDEELSPIVKESWIRSKKWKVNPFQPFGPIKKIEIERYQSLIDWAMPLMEGLYSIVKGSGFLVILCNEKGQLLKSIGDPDTLLMAEQIGFVEGADWSEQSVGTNAIGTSIVMDQPIQIFAEEHYSEICQSWTCSAAPIHDSKGNIIGVLILGESGTGKEMFAQAIHHESDRRNKPFIAINCGGIPRDLLGSELFGYVDGAFTGAKKG